MSPLLIHALRVLHILAASFWTGGALMNVGFLSPAIRASGPAGAQVMRHIVQVRRLPVVMNASALLTLITGTWLYGWRSAGFSGEWTASASGVTFGIGGVLGIAAALIGFFVIGRVVARIGPLAAQLAAGQGSAESAAELQRLQARMSIASKAGAALVVAAATLMAIARYV